jgi:aminoglycoside/choline kinase family phosphotransferase
MLNLYCRKASQELSAFDEIAFRAAYAVLGAQRNAKILGIFVRLNRRDGKPQYLAHMPRVARYFERDLLHPALDELRCWLDALVPASERLITPEA